MTGPDVQHARVLRLQTGDPVRVCDGAGHEWQGRISLFTPQVVDVSDLEPCAANVESALQVTLYQGMARGGKLELTVQKTTEMGLYRFVPMVTARSQVRITEAGSNKQQRWQEIARQAARQSGRTLVPEVAPPMDFSRAVQAAAQFNLAVMPFEHADGTQDWKRCLAGHTALRTFGLYIGPEGGFTDAEVEQARRAGIVPVSLGPRILRSETAGLAAVAMALYQWGDLGGTA